MTVIEDVVIGDAQRLEGDLAAFDRSIAQLRRSYAACTRAGVAVGKRFRISLVLEDVEPLRPARTEKRRRA